MLRFLPEVRGMRRAAAVLGFALALLAGFPAPAEPVRAPRVDWTLRVLPNGLKVYSVLDPSRTDVSVQVWYDVGSRDDPPGRSGLAHLAEHLMFKATRDMPAEYIDRMTERVGGFGNASTNVDYTEFHETVPAGELEPLLWAEAQRMSGLDLTPADLASERAVVAQELRESIFDDPYGRLFLFDIPAASFAGSPYQRATIGSLRELRAASLADVQAFHSRYYRPDNASLVVVGRFDPAALAAWVDRYFGPIAHPSAPVQRVSPAPARRRSPLSLDVRRGDAPAPAVVLSYAGPAAGAGDTAALSVLNAILGGADGSRAWSALVARQRLALDAFSGVELHAGARLIYVGAILADGRSPVRVEQALRRLVERMREVPPTPDELRTAKTELVLDMLRRRETLEGVGVELGQAALVQRDPGRVNTELAAIQAVTAQDVQRAARTYLLDAQRTTIRYHAAPDRPAAASADSTAADAAAIETSAPGAPITGEAVEPALAAVPRTRGRAALREPPASGGGAQAIALPRPSERRLANGLRVIVARSGGVPLATAVLAVHGGARLDPPDKAGLTQLSAALWLASSPDRSATQVTEALRRLGLTGTSGVDADAARISISGLSGALPEGLALMGQAVRRPHFDEGLIRRARRAMAEAVAPDELDSDALADKAVDLLVHGGLLGSVDAADPRSVARITRADVLSQYARLFRPDNAVLVLTGDVDPEAAFALAERTFGDWRNPPGAAPQARASQSAARGRTLLIDVPDAPMAEVVVAAPAAGRSDPTRYADELANSALGGAYTSRLNQQIRVRRGLTYDVSSTLEQRDRDGVFQARAETSTESAGEVAALMLAQMDALAAHGLEGGELGMRKVMLLGDLGRAIETSEDLAQLLAHEAIYGRPAGELAEYPEKLAAVSDGEVQAAAARLADPSTLSVVIVADGRRLATDLHRRFPRLTIVTPETLEQGSALRAAVAGPGGSGQRMTDPKSGRRFRRSLRSR